MVTYLSELGGKASEERVGKKFAYRYQARESTHENFISEIQQEECARCDYGCFGLAKVRYIDDDEDAGGWRSAAGNRQHPDS